MVPENRWVGTSSIIEILQTDRLIIDFMHPAWLAIVEAASRVLGEAALVDESVVERYRPERTPGQ